MTSALDDDDLALSINPSHTRRGSARSPSEQSQQNDPMQNASAAQARQSTSTQLSSQNRNSRLGQYNVVRTLGEGSFGKVKLAVHAVSKQKVALKIISRRKLVQRDMAGRVEREIQYLQLLRHPHIIKLYTVIPTPTEIIMVLEYAGSELFNYIVEHGKMVEDKARLFFQQIVCAVEYCHRHKIVHRDLKPENLLLDENLHVKIADFGLSNIMSDGNFLKTSCGSPNYAAPEVISGKLYAGPEVDVWSCGVILYVLLVGRLPFDDEYIPALFRKIAQGNYQVPPYLSPGASRIIRKMLQVSPVSRITIQEIRQDPWFMKNLPEYLQPPVEEFLDTGVDPAKPIDPRSLAPTKSTEIVEKLHNSVVGKLGKTMGYGREDVQQALAVDEPNAIKDAYLIVRENQIMRDTPSMARDPSLQPFLAQSPPVNAQSPIASGEGIPTLTRNAKAQSQNRPHASSPLKNQDAQQQSQPQMSPSRENRRGSINMTSLTEVRSPAGSNIAVLPSSLPDYHRAFMSGQPKASPKSSHPDDETSSRQTEPADPSVRARRLNPHSRSQINLERMNKPEGLTPLHQPEKKRNKPMKWQFGIRSKNHAAEAMLAIYRALKAMGADWEIPKMRKPGEGGSEGPPSPEESTKGDGGGLSGSDGGSDDDQDASDVSGDDMDVTNNGKDSFNDSFNSMGRGRGRYRYGSWNDWGYSVPEDPWIINARFRKGDLLPPGVLHADSASNSRVDLRLDTNSSGGDGAGTDSVAVPQRRSSALSNAGSAAGELSSSSPASGSNLNSASASIKNVDSTPATTSFPSAGISNAAQPSESFSNTAPAPSPSNPTSLSGSAAISSASIASSMNEGSSGRGSMLADDSAYIYLTIQLYAIEKDTYLVDFKCAGYERVVRRLAREIQGQTDLIVGTDGQQNAKKQRQQQGSRDSNAGSDDDNDDGTKNDDSDSDISRTDSLTKFESGRPREGGNWGAMRARRSDGSREASPVSPGTAVNADDRDDDTNNTAAIDRTDYAPGAEDTTAAPPPPSTTAMSASQQESGSRRSHDDKKHTRQPYVLKEDLIPRGRAVEEKDVSSPFPFLDVASRLIIQLARAD